MDSQYIFKTMYTIENMILQLEGTGKKEEYIRGIKKVYIDLMRDQYPTYAEIFESVTFKGQLLVTKNTAWQLELYSANMQQKIYLDDSVNILIRGDDIVGKIPQFYLLIDNEGRTFLRS